MFAPLCWAVPLENLPAEIALYLYRLWSNFLGLGFVVGLVGLVSDWTRRQKLHMALMLMFIGHLSFYLTYQVGDKELMFLPTYLIWGIWTGLGIAVLKNAIYQRGARQGFLTTTVLLMVVSSLVLNWGYVDISHDWRARQLGQQIFETVEPNAFYLGTWVDVPILEYLQLVEGQRPDVTTVNLLFLRPEEGERLAYEKLLTGYPLYTSSPQWFDRGIEFRELESCKCFKAVLASEPD
jgi:hypothetical protein